MYRFTGPLAVCAGYAFISLGIMGLLLEPSHAEVVKLMDSNFNQLVMADDGVVWLVEFYASWCSHCSRFKEQFLEISRILEGKVKVGAVDVDKNYDLTMKFDMEYLPHFLIFSKDKLNPKQYNGELSIDGLVKEALQEWKAQNENTHSSRKHFRT